MRRTLILMLPLVMMGITEGAIPFAAADPLRVIPCIIVGSMTASVIAMLGSVGDHAPHGGPIVLAFGAVSHALAYVVAILAGTLVTALCITVAKSFSSPKALAAKEGR